ncbi:MAG: chaperone modulator CbpM [Methylococcales bacterium]|nr:chaperone modulator CbpM [Methylococcales bacterium]
MTKEIEVYTGTVLNETIRFTLVEFCSLGKTSAEWVLELVDEGVLEPEGNAENDWLFDTNALKRLQKARRLQQDLRINLAGTALVLDLLEEIETLEAQIIRR